MNVIAANRAENEAMENANHGPSPSPRPVVNLSWVNEDHLDAVRVVLAMTAEMRARSVAGLIASRKSFIVVRNGELEVHRKQS